MSFKLYADLLFLFLSSYTLANVEINPMGVVNNAESKGSEDHSHGTVSPSTSTEFEPKSNQRSRILRRESNSDSKSASSPSNVLLEVINTVGKKLLTSSNPSPSVSSLIEEESNDPGQSLSDPDANGPVRSNPVALDNDHHGQMSAENLIEKTERESESSENFKPSAVTDSEPASGPGDGKGSKGTGKGKEGGKGKGKGEANALKKQEEANEGKGNGPENSEAKPKNEAKPNDWNSRFSITSYGLVQEILFCILIMVPLTYVVWWAFMRPRNPIAGVNRNVNAQYGTFNGEAAHDSDVKVGSSGKKNAKS